MSDPKMIRGIQEAVSIPVMAKCRIGHFVEAQVLEAIEIAGSRFTFGTDHGCALIDPAECLTEILCTADKRYFEASFVDMVNIICRRENLTLMQISDIKHKKNRIRKNKFSIE